MLPIPADKKENYVVGSTWNLVMCSMVMAAKFNTDEFEYDKMFAKFFGAKPKQATLTVLLHQYLSLTEFGLVVTSEQFTEKLDAINEAVAKIVTKKHSRIQLPTLKPKLTYTSASSKL